MTIYLFFQRHLYAIILVALLVNPEFILSQEPDSLWTLDINEIQVKDLRIDYKKLLRKLIKEQKAQLNKPRVENLIYELTYTGILDKEIQETGKATIAVTNNKRRWYSKYHRIKDLTYKSVDSVPFICEIKNYGMRAIFFEEPMSRKQDILYYDLKWKNSEVEFEYDGSVNKYTLSTFDKTKAEYYFDIDKNIDSIVVYLYPIFVTQPFVDKEIEKEDIIAYKAVYNYGNSQLESARVSFSFIKEERPVELQYELNFLGTDIDKENYLLRDSDEGLLPTTFTFEEAWRFMRRD